MILLGEEGTEWALGCEHLQVWTHPAPPEISVMLCVVGGEPFLQATTKERRAETANVMFRLVDWGHRPGWGRPLHREQDKPIAEAWEVYCDFLHGPDCAITQRRQFEERRNSIHGMRLERKEEFCSWGAPECREPDDGLYLAVTELVRTVPAHGTWDEYDVTEIYPIVEVTEEWEVSPEGAKLMAHARGHCLRFTAPSQECWYRPPEETDDFPLD